MVCSDGTDRCSVGEGVQRGTLDYCAPEALNHVAAASSMDMYSVGRIIMWLAIRDDNMWPDLAHGCTDEDKQAFLMAGRETTLGGIEHDATRNIIRRLTRMEPGERLTLEQLKACPYYRVSWLCRTRHLSRVE